MGRFLLKMVNLNKHMNWATKQGRYGVKLTDQALAQLLELCRTAGRNEVGGILIGAYDEPHTTAVITKVTGPTADSKQGPFWFHRGIKGLKRILDDLWSREKSYYLGEWHFHPYSSSSASGTDLTSLKSIAINGQYACPEPILLILGGDPSARWNVSVYVVDRHQKVCRLIDANR